MHAATTIDHYRRCEYPTQLHIQVRVLDRNTIFRDELIGTCQFDLLDVYMQPDHEVYRQWVALHDNECVEDQGVQGYLKLSVVVLGYKDRQHVHNLEEEVLEERANEASSGGLGGFLLSGPVTARQTLNFFVVYVVRAATPRPSLLKPFSF